MQLYFLGDGGEGGNPFSLCLPGIAMILTSKHVLVFLSVVPHLSSKLHLHLPMRCLSLFHSHLYFFHSCSAARIVYLNMFAVSYC